MLRRADVSPLALPAEQDQELDGLAVGRLQRVREAGVELRGLPRSQLDVVIAEDEPEPAVEHVQPLETLVRLRLGVAGVATAGDDHLEGQQAAGTAGAAG